MPKRRLVSVRVRRDSALERIQDATDNHLGEQVHRWAEADEQGWLEQFKTNNATPEGERE